jgi:Tfp pilus assembly protein PilF
MNKARLDKLLEYYENDPTDPFIIYGLANEYLEDDPQNALLYFEILLHSHKDYLPTYYMLATLYSELSQNENAKLTFEKGIHLAQLQNNYKTLAELKNAYQNFLFEH